jgi:NAD(P)-dependent dehydrogenase (short-subunit alcohol dehydrogenase family)
VSGALRDRSVRTRRPSPPWANDSARSAASARARGRVADLDRDRDSVRRSFDTKVIGRLMLAKHLAPRMTIGTVDDIAAGVVFALTSTLRTGQTLHIDGGEALT